MSDRPRIVVAEDHAPMRYTLLEILKNEFDVVAEAADGDAALRAIEQHKPDLALLDISMPLLSGIAVARRLKEGGSILKVVFVTGNTGMEYVREAQRIGVQGYIVKRALHSELIPALWEVLNGGVYFSQAAGVASHSVYD
jgi:DNA-binding NarL/FixJ family response regulator